ncbi:MAG: hypothetical protein NVSMB33_00680 [Ktedonobacteraceae bacterium]
MSEEQKINQPVSNKELPPKQVQAQTFSTNTSLWPFALAVALIIALVGVIANPILLGVGLLLSAATIIGWGLEKR